MAFIGLSRVVVAKRIGTGQYNGGVQLGKAVEVEVNPEYEESDYGDINDTDEEDIFIKADVKMKTSRIPLEAERLLFGHEVKGNEVIYCEEDRAEYVGIGINTQEIISGKKTHIALWIYKAKLREEGQTLKTKGKSIEYMTPEVKGKAIPEEDGKWKIKKIFETKEDAVKWVNQMAGIE